MLARDMEVCLDCACRNAANDNAKRLLESCGATTTTGVTAALFIASVSEHIRIAGLVVAALEEQRRGCYPSACERLAWSRSADKEQLLSVDDFAALRKLGINEE
jgi:hypothetical protein